MNEHNATALDDLMRWAENQGVALTVFELDETTWELSDLAREEDTPKGTGRSVLLRLTQEADARGCAVSLVVTGSNSVLEDLYAQFHFVADGPRDLETGDLNMRRHPARVVLEPRKRPSPR
jgi:hypothetical protein